MRPRAGAKRLVRAVARRAAFLARRGLLRLLRPFVTRIDLHLQWLFDRHQADRARLMRLEQQVAALQREVASQRSPAA